MAAIFTRFAFVLWVIFIEFYSNIANAELVVKPKDTVVLVNQPTYFNCSTSVRNKSASFVVWYHYPSGSPSRNDVYDEGQIMHEYKDRFSIETNVEDGVFNLVVERPTVADAGRYECQDGVGQGDKAPAELIVLDGNPSCESNVNPDGVIGPNDCGIEPDVMQLTCNVTSSHGNILPTLEWKISGDESSSSLVVCERPTSCKLTLRANLTFNSKSFVCQTTNARRQQYGCSIGPIKVKYAVSSGVKRATEGDAICYANSSQTCTYKWYDIKGGEVSSDKNLVKQKPGKYQCTAQCELNRQNDNLCRFTAMEIEIVSPAPVSDAQLAVILVPIIVFIIAVLIIIGICLYRHRMNHRKPDVRQNEKDESSLLSKGNDTPNADATSTGQNEKEEISLLHRSNDTPDDAVDGQISSLPIISGENMVDTLVVNQYFIDRGSTGAIYGPFTWTGKKCALKQILYSPDKITEERKNEINQQRNRCKELNHPHLVKVFEVWFPSPALYILMEYAEARSLDKILRPKDATPPLLPFSNEIVQDWALQIADGMRYLHKQKIVHRNLKAAHVLVMKLPNVFPNSLKIGSYTLAAEHDHSTVMSLKGTMAWMAPEYIRGEKFSTLSDVWSYGVTVWEILTRDVPYKEMRKETDLVRAAMNRTLKLEIPESCPEQLRSVLTDCWNYEVDERPSFTGICDCLG